MSARGLEDRIYSFVKELPANIVSFMPMQFSITDTAALKRILATKTGIINNVKNVDLKIAFQKLHGLAQSFSNDSLWLFISATCHIKRESQSRTITTPLPFRWQLYDASSLLAPTSNFLFFKV